LRRGWTGIRDNCPSGKSLGEKRREVTAAQRFIVFLAAQSAANEIFGILSKSLDIWQAVDKFNTARQKGNKLGEPAPYGPGILRSVVHHRDAD
jgi:hypothetical protein